MKQLHTIRDYILIIKHLVTFNYSFAYTIEIKKVIFLPLAKQRKYDHRLVAHQVPDIRLHDE